MQIADLNGRWTLAARDDGQWRDIPVEIPGGVHPALMAAGRIGDPGAGDNAETLKWIGETTWVFERPFTVDAAFLAHAIVDLVFDGLDTMAAVFVNDRPVLEADDMFRRWSAEVKDALHEGENRVRVEIRPAAPGRGRKARYGFGSIYSPACVTAGICRPVHLRAWNGARMCDLGISQEHDEAGGVTLFMGGLIEVAGDVFEGYRVVFSITDPDGEPVWQGDGQVAAGDTGAFHCRVSIDDPLRWWPNGMGDQPLYTVQAVLTDGADVTLDRVVRRIGLRTLSVQTDAAGIVRMMCNGRPVFLQGAVWIPPGLFPSHITPEDYAFLVGSAAEVGMNALRMWEGGVFEDDLFWETCDAAGIVVTGLAGMFQADSAEACADAGADASVGPPLHACLPDDWVLEPDATNGLRVLRTPVSFPHPDTLEAQVPAGSRNLTGPVMETRVAGTGGAAGLVGSLAAQWPLASSFRDWAWLSQLAQSVEVCSAILAARADPNCSGVMWEPFASCWAIADGSSIDADGRWKALQYRAQTAFAAVALDGVVREPGRVDVRLINAADTPCRVSLTWRATTLAGLVLDEGAADGGCAGGASAIIHTVDVRACLEQYSPGNVVVWLSARDDEGFLISRTPVLFTSPRRLALEDPHLAVDIDDTLDVDGEEAIRVTLSAASPAFWVWLDIPGEPAQFSDNFVCLEPDEPVEIYVSTVSRMTQFAFRRRLRVRSLYDIAQAAPECQEGVSVRRRRA